MTNNEIEQWLDADPITIALKTGDSKLAERIDVLQRSKNKVPSYFNVRAEFTKIELEQSTSEVVASSRIYSGGELAIDLTTGLGVDTFYLSKRYKKVISVELDSRRSIQAASNFTLLGATNIETINSSAEDFISSFDGTADIIFVDPSRRDDSGNRIYDIGETKPDIISLLPIILSKTKELVVKCSPMFDIQELVSRFGHNCSSEIISLDGECKEILVKISNKVPQIDLTILSSKNIPQRYSFPMKLTSSKRTILVDSVRYFATIDVAFVKARTIDAFMSEYYPEIGYIQTGSYLLLNDNIENPVLKSLKISSIEPFKLSDLKRKFKNKKVSVLRKGFPISIAILKRQLGFQEGGTEQVAFVQIDGEKYVVYFSGVQ